MQNAEPEQGDFPVGPTVGPDAVYRGMLARHQLAYQHCQQCSAAVFPPRLRCPACGADALEWRESAGSGTVYSASTLAPRDTEPFCVALIDVDEGFRLMTNVVGTPPGEVQIGDRVTVAITGGTGPDDAAPLPLFEVTR